MKTLKAIFLNPNKKEIYFYSQQMIIKVIKIVAFLKIQL